MIKTKSRHLQNEKTPFPQEHLPIIPRKQAVEQFEAILPLDARECVLNVYGGGGMGKTWFLKGLQKYCEQEGLLYNRQLIDFYDTTNQRVGGVTHSIIREIDPSGQFFAGFLEKCYMFDRGRAQGYSEQSLRRISDEMDQDFLACLRQFGRDRRKDGRRGVVLMFDTYDEPIQESRVGHWLLDEFLEATEDIAVIIAGRPPKIAPEKAKVPIRFWKPSNFSLKEIANYINLSFGKKHQDLGFDRAGIHSLAEFIHEKSDGVPVTVALTLDVANLACQKNMNLSSIRSLLVEADSYDSFELGLLRRLVALLGDVPSQQWAMLYMAHLRRRFTEDIYSFLQGKTTGDSSADLKPFETFYVTKCRYLGDEQEICILPHDLIRQQLHRAFWDGAMPIRWVYEGQKTGLFPPELVSIWTPYPEEEDFCGERLRAVLDWLDSKIIAYCQERRQILGQEQEDIARQDPGWLDKSEKVDKWIRLEQQCEALIAEQLLYEMDQNLERGWRRFRREYDGAFEAYRQGHCEQLEQTVLNAWTKDELKTNPPAERRKAEIQDMVRVRQLWWPIRYSQETRLRAVGQLLAQLGEEEPTDREGAREELLADVFAALGWAFCLQKNLTESMAYREQAARLYRKLGLEREAARALNFLGETYAQMGDFSKSDACWEESMKIASRQDPKDQTELASVAMKRAYYKDLAGELGPALGYARLAIELFSKLGDKRRLAIALIYQGRVYLANVRLHHAEDSLRQAEQLLSLVGDKSDEILLEISWGEFYRRLAIDKIGKQDQTPENDFAQAHEYLEQAIRVAREEEREDLEIEAQGELGVFHRDQARYLAEDKRQIEKAHSLWEKSAGILEQALARARYWQAWFQVADLLDALCDLYSDQRRAGIDTREKLEKTLNELEEIATGYGYARFLSRVAENRARLCYEDGQYEDAIKYFVEACRAAGLHTHSSHVFRRSYDQFVVDLEEHLWNLPDPLRVALAQKAMSLWGRMGHAGNYPQLILACQRVLYPAQARLEEANAEIAFEAGREAEKAGDEDLATQHYNKAFYLYVQACYHSGLMEAASYASHAAHAALVDQLERQLYNLERPESILHYSEYVEAEWHRLGQASAHSDVLEVCQRAMEISHILLGH